LSEEELFAVLPSLNWWDRDAVDLAGEHIRFERRTLRPGGEPNRYNQLLLNPAALVGDGQKSRFYYIASRAPEVLDDSETDDAGNPLPQGWREVLLNVTNLGVTSKLSGNSGLVWVTRLSDGGAQAGAEVVVRERSGGVLWRGTTGADGVVTLPGRAALMAKRGRPSGAPPAAEGTEEEEDSDQVGELLVFARLGDDVTFVDPDASGRFASWSFGVPSETLPKELALRGFLHTDRGLYRPGDTVHLRGLMRLLRLGGGLFVPPRAEAVVSVSDPNGRELVRQTLPVSKFGGFSFDHALSEVAPLGDYRVLAQLPQGEFSETFAVEEFRAATFEVQLAAAAKEAFAGGTLKLSSSGRYFYGAPVRAADVKLSVHASARTVTFDGYEDYSFMHDPNPFDRTPPYGEEALLTEQSAKLDSEGRAGFEVQLPVEQFVSPSTLLISATVQDETNQTAASDAAVSGRRHRRLGRAREGATKAALRGARPRGQGGGGGGHVQRGQAELVVRVGALGLPGQLPLRGETAGGGVRSGVAAGGGGGRAGRDVSGARGVPGAARGGRPRRPTGAGVALGVGVRLG